MAAETTRRTSTSGTTRGVAALDRLAERLTAAAGVGLGVADSPAELVAAHRLRYRDAAAHGRGTSADALDGMERDAFDSRALQLCAWEGERLVGTLRMVLPMPGKPLPLEAAFGLLVEPVDEVVEIGGAVLVPELGGERARRIADGLLAQAWFEARARGYLVIAGVASTRLIEHFRAQGLDIEVLRHGSDDRAAVRLDPSV